MYMCSANQAAPDPAQAIQTLKDLA